LLLYRELAIQIAEQFHALGKGISLKYSVIIGGMGMYTRENDHHHALTLTCVFCVDMTKQAQELTQRPHIVIATPGRLAELMNMGSKTVQMNKLRYLVFLHR
jgi:ATP-dependent RNA helicase DDX49/DBP8